MKSLGPAYGEQFRSAPTQRYPMSPYSGPATVTILAPGRSKGIKRNTGSWRPQTAFVGNSTISSYF